MAKDQKPEKSKTKKPVTTPSTLTDTVKSNGKRVIDPPELAIPSSANGANSNSKATEKQNLVEVSSEDNSVEKANGVVSKNTNILYQIPMNRISRIIKSEDPNIRISQEAIFIINKASEKFLQVFATEAYANAFLDRKKHIDYKNLSSVVSKRRRFDFLSDFVPEKVKAEDALKEVSASEICNGC